MQLNAEQALDPGLSSCILLANRANSNQMNTYASERNAATLGIKGAAHQHHWETGSPQDRPEPAIRCGDASHLRLAASNGVNSGIDRCK